MARGSIYKAEVVRARDNLRARGINPSIDAIRVELGNTGSKSTIHRLLREIAEEEGERKPAASTSISDALQDLVGRLAERVQAEADGRIEAAQEAFSLERSAFESQLSTRQQELEHAHSRLASLQLALDSQTNEADALRQRLQEQETEVVRLIERAAGLEQQLLENRAHLASMEDKHRHAREALEHYRNASKEQREQELRRHEHQVQQLQIELRQRSEALTGKDHELIGLIRDNGRLTLEVAERERDLRQQESECAEQAQRAQALREQLDEQLSANAQLQNALEDFTRVRERCEQLESRCAEEQRARVAAEAECLRHQGQVQGMEEWLSRLTRQLAAAAVQAANEAPREIDDTATLPADTVDDSPVAKP